MFGKQSDRAAIATNDFVHRGANVLPSDAGQFGVALTQSVQAWATRFGAYLTQFHSRSGYSGFTKSQRLTGAPYVPASPDGLNPTYYTEWQENIRMLGLNFETCFEVGTTFGELTYRPNQPLQFNAADLLNAVVSNTAPTLLRDRANALPPGGALTGYERHKTVQLLFGADVSGWSGDGAIVQGRRLAALSLRASFSSGFVGNLTWAPTWGGTYNNQRDRSAVILYIGQRF